jgi:hypothetical protein
MWGALSDEKAALGSSLYSLGSDSRENAVSIVIVQQYFDCCLRIVAAGTCTQPLPSNGRLLTRLFLSNGCTRCNIKYYVIYRSNYIATNFGVLTRKNVRYVASHERASTILFQCLVCKY